MTGLIPRVSIETEASEDRYTHQATCPCGWRGNLWMSSQKEFCKEAILEKMSHQQDHLVDHFSSDKIICASCGSTMLKKGAIWQCYNCGDNSAKS